MSSRQGNGVYRRKGEERSISILGVFLLRFFGSGPRKALFMGESWIDPFSAMFREQSMALSYTHSKRECLQNMYEMGQMTWKNA